MLNVVLSERVLIQQRRDAWNVFIRTHFGSLDKTSRFDAVGRQVNIRFDQVFFATTRAASNWR